MIQIHFKLILNPSKNMFEFTFGQNPILLMDVPIGKSGDSIAKKWDLTALETEQLIKNARKQLVDATDAMTEFVLHTGDYKFNLHGVKSKEAFQGLVEYLEKVWDSFRRSSHYVEIYPQ